MRPLKSLTLEAIVNVLATPFGTVDDPRAADGGVQLELARHALRGVALQADVAHTSQ